MRYFLLAYIIFALLTISFEREIVRTWKGWFGKEEVQDYTSVHDQDRQPTFPEFVLSPGEQMTEMENGIVGYCTVREDPSNPGWFWLDIRYMTKASK